MNKEWKKQKSLLEGKMPGCSCSKLMILLENVIFSDIFYAKTLPPSAGRMCGDSYVSAKLDFVFTKRLKDTFLIA